MVGRGYPLGDPPPLAEFFEGRRGKDTGSISRKNFWDAKRRKIFLQGGDEMLGGVLFQLSNGQPVAVPVCKGCVALATSHSEMGTQEQQEGVVALQGC